MVRVAGKLAPPLRPEPLDWTVTQKLAEQFLAPEHRTSLDQHGSADLPFYFAGVYGNLTIFYGNGCHNLVFHLAGGNGNSA